MKNLILNNKEYLAEEIATINTPKSKIRAQRKLGISVIANTMKALNFAAWSETISCIIYYKEDNSYISKFMHNILSRAANRGCDVYIKENEEYTKYISQIDVTTARDRYLEKQAYKDIDSVISLELDKFYKGQRVPEKRKSKMKNFIRYYELPFPQTESEWVNTFYQLKFYIENKVPYSFDENLYYICEECGELVRRGTEEEHVCYAEIAPKRTHLDYVLNGEEGDEY